MYSSVDSHLLPKKAVALLRRTVGQDDRTVNRTYIYIGTRFSYVPYVVPTRYEVGPKN